jgi:hypothetical protein
MKILDLTIFLFAAASISGCTGQARMLPRIPSGDLSAPEPILGTDQVKDAKTAIHLALARCFPKEPEALFQAELQKDHWFVWSDSNSGSFSADVAKNDGAVSGCQNIEM